MALAFWNIRGINDDLRRAEVKSRIKKLKFDLFALLETKVREINFEHFSKCFGSNFRVITNNSETENGDSIWLWWDEGVWELEVIKLHKYYIHALAKNRGGVKNPYNCNLWALQA